MEVLLNLQNKNVTLNAVHVAPEAIYNVTSEPNIYYNAK